MSSLKLTKESNVYVLTLNDPGQDNTFTPEVLDEYDAALNEIEGDSSNAALVITSSLPKTWCNGINLNWMTANSGDFQPFIMRLDQFLLRLALLNIPTVGSLVGNTYAGGAIMAAALDFRFMRADKGRFCFSEVDFKLAFTPIMTAIIKLLPNQQALKEMALTGIRLGGEECYQRQIVDNAYSEQELLPKSMEYAQMLASKDRTTYGLIKHQLRKDLLQFKGNA